MTRRLLTIALVFGLLASCSSRHIDPLGIDITAEIEHCLRQQDLSMHDRALAFRNPSGAVVLIAPPQYSEPEWSYGDIAQPRDGAAIEADGSKALELCVSAAEIAGVHDVQPPAERPAPHQVVRTLVDCVENLGVDTTAVEWKLVIVQPGDQLSIRTRHELPPASAMRLTAAIHTCLGASLP